MADENTTDSTQTTATTAPPAADLPSSTTATSPAADAVTPPPAAGASTEADGGTLLTPAADGDGGSGVLTPEEQTAADAKAALFGAPDGDYEISGLPEGTVIDTDALAALTPIAKELGLSNDGASKLANIYAEQLPRITQGVTDQILASHAATTKGWADEAVEAVKTDTAFGGKPLPEVQAIAAKALDRFGGTEFRQYLADTGLGNHPAMVKAMFLAGSAIAEDTTFERGSNVPPTKTREEKYYPKATTT